MRLFTSSAWIQRIHVTLFRIHGAGYRGLARDTLTAVRIDSALLESMKIQLYQIAFNRIVSPTFISRQ